MSIEDQGKNNPTGEKPPERKSKSFYPFSPPEVRSSDAVSRPLAKQPTYPPPPPKAPNPTGQMFPPPPAASPSSPSQSGYVPYGGRAGSFPARAESSSSSWAPQTPAPPMYQQPVAGVHPSASGAYARPGIPPQMAPPSLPQPSGEIPLQEKPYYRSSPSLEVPMIRDDYYDDRPMSGSQTITLKGTLAALVATIISTIVYSILAITTGFEWRFVGLGIGFGIGYAANHWGGRGFVMGVVCVGFFVGAIAVGRTTAVYAIMSQGVDITSQYSKSKLQTMYYDSKAVTEEFERANSDEKLRIFIYTYTRSGARRPQEVTDEQLATFKNSVLYEELMTLAGTDFSYEEWVAFQNSRVNTQAPDFMLLLFNSIHWWDYAFLFIGGFLAFYQGSRKEGAN